MAHDGLMVRVSGIRGRVGEALTPEVVAQVRRRLRRVGVAARRRRTASSSAATAACRARCFIGWCCRRSQSVGCDVIDIGLTTTPTCQLAVEHHHAAGGLMISASHNPIEWNALKFIGPTGLFLENAEGVEMRALVDREFRARRGTSSATSSATIVPIERHIERVLAIPYLDVDGIRAAKVQRGAGLRARRGRGHHAAAARAAGLHGRRDQPRDRRALSASPGAGSPRTSAIWNGSCFRRCGDRLCRGSGRRSPGAGVGRRTRRSAKTSPSRSPPGSSCGIGAGRW